MGRKPYHIAKGKSSPEVLRAIMEAAEPPALRFPYSEWPALSPLVVKSEGWEGLAGILFGTEADPGLARFAGWKVAHVKDSRLQPDMEGFPDWILARESVIFVELKRDTDRLSGPQCAWATALLRADAHYELWRPKDWWPRIGEIILHGPDAAAEMRRSRGE